VAERPYLVTLNAASGELSDVLVLVVTADLAHIGQKLEDRSLRRAGHAASRPDGVAFHKGADDLRSPFGTQLVHSYIMHDRLRIVNREWSNSAENVDGGPRPPR